MLQADSCLRHLCTAPNMVNQLHSSLQWPLPSEPALEHVTAAGLHLLAPLGVLDVLQEVVLERQDQSGTNRWPHGGQRGYDGHGMEEGGCGWEGTHWTSLSLVYSIQTFVCINTCTIHGEVHVCAHTSTNLTAAPLARPQQTPSSSHSQSSQKQF